MLSKFKLCFGSVSIALLFATLQPQASATLPALPAPPPTAYEQIEKQHELCIRAEAAAGTSGNMAACTTAATEAAQQKAREISTKLIDQLPTENAKKALRTDNVAFETYAQSACKYLWSDGLGDSYKENFGPACVYAVWLNRLKEVEDPHVWGWLPHKSIN